MLTRFVTTVEGDVLDALIWRHLGQCDDAVLTSVYALNPGLCDVGATLPPGVAVRLPNDVTPFETIPESGLKLWD